MLLLCLLVLLVACGGASEDLTEQEPTMLPAQATRIAQLTGTPNPVNQATSEPVVDLTLTEEDLTVEPFPLRAGFPFSVTVLIRNNGETPAVDVPVLLYISAQRETIGYTPFLKLFTVTLPASQSLPVEVPVNWQFAGGEHKLWLQVNRLPATWQTRISPQPEADTRDNMVLSDLMVAPFDAYTSDLCPGRVDIDIGPADVLPEPDRQRVLVWVHNAGNQAAYNLPVVVIGDDTSGIAYTPAIPPCGGTAEVYV
ncbi:MAG: hypothetical protein PVH17_10475, partial [Anaerolineae bacterium]